MKKITLVFAILICMGYVARVQAQQCSTPASGPSVCSTANSPLTAEGFYPSDNDLPCVIDGEFYDTVIQIRTPSSVTSGGSSYSLNYIQITSLTNLPCGLCWACGNSSNQINGNADGCIRVQGTSYDVPGQYLLDIIVTANVTAFGVPISEGGENLSSQGLKFFAKVQLPESSCPPIDTTSNGLTATTQGNVSVPSISGPTQVCSGSNSTLTVSGGNYYGYVWSTGAHTASINVTTSGTYTVTVYENCNYATASQTVLVQTAPTVTITPPTSICTGSGATTITATGGTSYTWNNAATTSSITVSPSSTTSYSVTVSNGSNCTVSATTTLTVNTSPTAAITPTADTVCSGTQSTLTAVGTGSYNWSTGATTASINVTPASTTVYTLTVSSASSCTATASRTVVVNSSAPTILANGPTTFCTGGTVELALDSPFATYLWSTGATTSSITVNTAGTYTATVTQNGCTGVSNSIAVSVASNLSPTITANPSLNICPGGRTTLDAGSGYSNYTWSGGNGTHETVQVSSAGTYTVTVSSGTCSGSASVTVNVGNFPLSVSVTPAGPVSSCTGDTVTLDAGSGFASYAWSNGSQVAATQVTSTGSYSVTVTKNACVGADTIQVTVNPTPAPVITPAGPVTACTDSTVTLDAGAGFASYLWSNGATTETIQPTTTASYSVTVTQAGCTGAAASPVSVTFNTSPAPVISPAGSVNVCSSSGGVELNAGAGYTSYLWNNSATTQTINVTTAGPYTVTVTQNGCPGIAAATNVNVVTTPVASIAQPVSSNGVSYLTASPSGVSYQWLVQNSPNGSYSVTGKTSQTDTVTCGNAAAYYTVVATQSGCSDSSAQAEVVCTGINEISSLVSFTMEPNPATDMLFVSYGLNDNTSIKLSVIDLTGRIVLPVLDNTAEGKGTYQRQINLTSLSAGVYLLNFVTNNGSFNARFVKQ